MINENPQITVMKYSILHVSLTRCGSHLYKRFCLWVDWSVHPSARLPVRPSVGRWVRYACYPVGPVLAALTRQCVSPSALS